MPILSLYLSRILGNKILLKNGEVLGKLKDIGVSTELTHPIAISMLVKTKSGVKEYKWENIKITKKFGQYELMCTEPIEANGIKDVLYLSKNVLDKQIIDVNGRKVVRVNDIRLALLDKGLFAIAVDIGVEGILRRLGLAKPLKRILKRFGKTISSKFILWEDIETITRARENIMLSKTYHKLATLHPSDLADIIEDLDFKAGIDIFSSLEHGRAADVLEEMETDTQRSILNELPVSKAADILEEMPADEVADILDDLNEEKVEELLNEMENNASLEVRELMEYPEYAVGSLMTTDFVAFENTLSVEEAIKELRLLKPDEDIIYYIYIVDESNRLLGAVTLRDLVISEPNTLLNEIMNKDIIYTRDMDSIKSLIKTVTKYNLVAIPVVDEDMKLLGTVLINDIIYELMRSGKTYARR
ncbi:MULTISPECIES: magnesium transporter [Thermoanaerobacterium]|uniref:Signal transduction protein with CBS domains n=2 Tax=Thermoanaerobacterium TaxID=28895 RepID=I3VSQ2_THESW|nr:MULTISPECIES: CBS domain-containing protein [Thermoanaerobacterium]AFK85547.1 putative signal transduction protein with CBS domains [Thermoanaerobacterium saccharolyticum JW/SL-YS485]ETO39736.1 putative signal transduction protein [Thermoanaerobacterium aotearoense SCUT27]